MADEDTMTEEDPTEVFAPSRRLDPDPTPTGKFDLDWNAEDFDSDSPKLTVADATRIISKRLPLDSSFVRAINQSTGDPFAANTKGLSESFAELARKMATMIPDELMTRDALENMDLRAPLQQMMMAAGQESPDGTSEINGLEFTDMERRIAGLSLVTLTEKYSEEWGESAVGRINEGLDVEKQTTAIDEAVQDALGAYRDGTVQRVPDPKNRANTFGLDPETGRLISNSDDIIGAGVEGEFNADFDVDENPVERRFLSAQDIQKMLAGGEIDIDFLRQVEQADIYGDPTATDPNAPRAIDHGARVTYTDDLRDSGNKLPDHLAGPDRRDMEKDWYSVTEVLQLPSTFTPEERVLMVKRLENAGFLAKGEVVGGDTTSQAFKNAWKNLASSALERGVSMTSFLDEREKTYQESVMAQFATRLTDPARIRSSGNTIGKSVLGRKLNDDEQKKLEDFVRDLERQNAMTEAGLSVTETGEPIEGVEGLDEGVIADIDARMEEYIREQGGAEAGAKDVADQYEQFTRMLSGPGRGVS